MSDQSTDYLESEVNIFSPSTPFMRDHLRIIWGLFGAWVLVVFGPVTITFLAPDIMAGASVLGFPLHYLLTAIVAPSGALLLSWVYARKRDQLDEKYGIHHSSTQQEMESDVAATSGGVNQ